MNTRTSTYTANNILPKVAYNPLNTNAKTCIMNYRYGFNGQEKVNEVYGFGNLNIAEFWLYDTRLARRWNRDPIDQISMSNYSVLSNSPIIRIDPNGDTDFYNSKGKYVGNDGKSNNLIGIIDNKKVLQQVKKNQKANNGIITLYDEKSNTPLKNGSILFDTFFIDKDVLKAANNILTKAIESSEIREYGQTLQTQEGGGAIAMTEIIKGPIYDESGQAGVDLIANGDVSIHSHPVQKRWEGEGMDSKAKVFDALKPSEYDKEAFLQFNMNIIVGENNGGGRINSDFDADNNKYIYKSREFINGQKSINIFNSNSQLMRTIQKNTADKILK